MESNIAVSTTTPVTTEGLNTSPLHREVYSNFDGPQVYGYARVSTQGQARDGNSLIDQQRLLRAAGAVQIFSDSYTGTKESRPELNMLLRRLKPGDTVIVTKLDRIARSTIGGIEIIEKINKMGVTLNILNMGVFNDTPTGRLMRTMLLAFAEFERDMILERTSAGKAIAKERNPDYKEGRPKVFHTKTKVNEIHRLMNAEGISAVEACNRLGVSKSWYYKNRNALLEKNPDFAKELPKRSSHIGLKHQLKEPYVPLSPEEQALKDAEDEVRRIEQLSREFYKQPLG